jgi:hypothetical protein
LTEHAPPQHPSDESQEEPALYDEELSDIATLVAEINRLYAVE